MSALTLAVAQKLLADTLAYCREHNFNPMSVVVLDADSSIRAAASEDGTTFMRWRVAYGKAYGAVAFGMPSRRLNTMAAERPHFVDTSDNDEAAAVSAINIAGFVADPG